MLKSQRFDEWAGTGINFSEPFGLQVLTLCLCKGQEEAAGGK